MINETNVDNVYLRSATVAALHYLNSNLSIEQVEKGIVKTYKVPVFFNKAQDSQFMRDYFTQYGDDCQEIEFADGDYDMEPFGILNLESFTINTSKMTSKFIRGIDKKTEYDENGYKVKKGYSACLFTLPLDLKFGLEFRCDDSVQSFRVVQSLMDNIYKNGVVQFPFKEVLVRANIALDNGSSIDKKISFNWNEEQYQTVKTSLAMECYYPIFDQSTALFRGDVILKFRRFLNGMEDDIVPKDDTIEPRGIIE